MVSEEGIPEAGTMYPTDDTAVSKCLNFFLSCKLRVELQFEVFTACCTVCIWPEYKCMHVKE